MLVSVTSAPSIAARSGPDAARIVVGVTATAFQNIDARSALDIPNLEAKSSVGYNELPMLTTLTDRP